MAWRSVAGAEALVIFMGWIAGDESPAYRTSYPDESIAYGMISPDESTAYRTINLDKSQAYRTFYLRLRRSAAACGGVADCAVN